MSEHTKILIVEDEGITAEEIKIRLQHMGYRVCAMAASGKEAIALAEKHRPDLIIMDIKLKGKMDGITAARTIRETMDVPVIFLTANAGEAMFNRARQAGPDAFISKPYTPLDLGHSIDIALTRHQMETRVRESETRYRRLVEDMPYMMSRFNSDLALTFVNNATGAFFGADREELLGSSYLKFVPEKERKPVIDAVRSLTAENPIVKIEHRVALPDGRTRWLRRTIRYLREAGGVAGEYQSIGEDITELRRLEEEVIKIAEEERRQISQDLHDDLGQKLSYLGFLAEMEKKSMARDTNRDVGRIDAMIHLIQNAIDHVRGIARGLRPVAPGPDGFAHSIENHVAELRRLLGVKIRLKRQGRLFIKDDFAAAHLYQIVRELLHNAIKYGNKGNISLTMRESGQGIMIVIKNRIEGRGAEDGARGMGLDIIRHRAHLIGAVVRVYREKEAFCAELSL